MAQNNNTGPAVVHAFVVLSTILLAVTWTVNGENNGLFLEEWQRPTSNLFTVYANAKQGMAKSGNADKDAHDGWSLKLTLSPNARRGVSGSPAAKTKSRYKYGTYWARAKTANCSGQAKAGVVTGIFTYFNDGADRNGNGLPDNNEIDFEWLCAEPEVVYLTIWTDYRESDPAKFRNVHRTINIKIGKVLMECYRERFGWCSSVGKPLSKSERRPTKIKAISNYDSSARYYDYGITFEANRVHFMIVANGVTHTLWTIGDPLIEFQANRCISCTTSGTPITGIRWATMDQPSRHPNTRSMCT
ncbi:unnamed protein product [Sphagnum jensenii]|uniref:GH16 domain-containing protein n=1 Tax=Sphagnum jensenii TaxID=128206 RepID=A0ABP0V6U5_9BRYO